MAPNCSIRFGHHRLSNLRSRLLEDLSREQFAILLARKEMINNEVILNVVSQRIALESDLISQSMGHVRPSKEFVYDILAELQSRYDVDTLIDVHTHPFAVHDTQFSGVDDADEKTFARFISSHFDDLAYASIVFSQYSYEARLWNLSTRRPEAEPAIIRCQTPREIGFASSKKTAHADMGQSASLDVDQAEMFDRVALVIGAETFRNSVQRQRVMIIGLGGLGSVIAENLVHLGIRDLTLIDHDVVDRSNLSRLVGASYDDATQARLKVDVVANHLRAINPVVIIDPVPESVEFPGVAAKAASMDWIIVATDNHASRAHAQALSIKYFVPMISAGVNITVRDGAILDMSGEVIVSRLGDGLCLHCLGRINPTTVAAEKNSSADIRTQLVERGYVRGASAKEPAVKTLNSIVGSLAVDRLMAQLVGDREECSVIVYDCTGTPRIYPDTSSVYNRHGNCFVCGVVD